MYKPDFSTRITDELRELGDFYLADMPEYALGQRLAADLIEDSVKFMLPEEGRCLLEEDGLFPVGALQLIHLPFPKVFIQWTSRQWTEGAWGLLLVELSPEILDQVRPLIRLEALPDQEVNRRFQALTARDGLYGMFVVHEFKDDSGKRWAETSGCYIFHPSDVMILQDSTPADVVKRLHSALANSDVNVVDALQESKNYVENRVESTIESGKGNRLRLGGNTFCFFQRRWGPAGPKVFLNDWLVASRQCNELAPIAVDFCMTINCSNVESEKHTPPDSLNAKRVKTGKPPFSEYRTLVVDEGSENGRAASGTHASPRHHLRRGHIRVTASGKAVWVRAHTVGNPANGTIRKNYLLK